jgi:acetyl/propionyl-CoA carboxylase alpha subunit
MRRALTELRIVGVSTSVPFHLAVMGEPDFRSGELDIHYLDRKGEELTRVELTDEEVRVVAVAAALLEEEHRTRRTSTRTAPAEQTRSAWRGGTGWRGR